MTDFFIAAPMKYYMPSASMSATERRMRLEQMIESGNYVYGLKTDGNYTRAVITDDRAALQTRGISVKTKTYGEVQDKVMFWDAIVNAFQGQGTTVILGETYLDGGIDADVGSILRCLPQKALARQKDKPLKWRIFDVLAYKGKELINIPFVTRIDYIDKIVKEINHPLVTGVEYYDMEDDFFDVVGEIFESGGEGVVCYKRDALYEFGKRGPHAWDSVKVKQEIASDIDCFIIGIEKPTQQYNGKEISNWPYWYDTRTGEMVYGEYFGEYQTGGSYIPVTKNYFYNLPGAVNVGVYDKNRNIIPLCKVAGLTDDFKKELRDNFEEWYMCPMTIGGMMVSEAHAQENGVGISIRHPYIKAIRRDDISPDDCTLSKIID